MYLNAFTFSEVKVLGTVHFSIRGNRRTDGRIGGRYSGDFSPIWEIGWGSSLFVEEKNSSHHFGRRNIASSFSEIPRSIEGFNSPCIASNWSRQYNLLSDTKYEMIHFYDHIRVSWHKVFPDTNRDWTFTSIFYKNINWTDIANFFITIY